MQIHKSFTEQLSDETEGWIHMLEQEEESSEFAWRHLVGARFCDEVQALFSSPVQDDAWLLQMLQQVKEAVLINERFQAWFDNETSGMWSQREVRNPNANTEDGPTYVYHDFAVGLTYNNFRAALIHVNEVLCHCIQLIKWHPSFEADTYLDDIRETATRQIQKQALGIKASTSFCLGDIDSMGNELEGKIPLMGMAMMWPIYRAIRSLREGCEDQLWLTEKLQYISDELGWKGAGKLLRRARQSSWDTS